MDNNFGAVKKDDDQMELPPGFRFHPTDEELITCYLAKKVVNRNFSAVAIGEVDMNTVEPWDLPWRAKLGENEWYFFCIRDKKYPTGLRTNRATAAGYWKATGKDTQIFRGKILVGMKKTLVFYKGRAPKGVKTNWVTHEYRLEGKLSLDGPANSDWVISRVFHKTSGGQKVHISGLRRASCEGNELNPSALPPLMETSSYRARPGEQQSNHVHCFSSSIASPHQIQEEFFNNPVDYFPAPSAANAFSWGQFSPIFGAVGFQVPGSIQTQEDASIFRSLLGNYGHGINHIHDFRREGEMVVVSQETALSTDASSVVSNLEIEKRGFEEQEAPSTSGGPQDLHCIWG